jgi:hypothetical protein
MRANSVSTDCCKVENSFVDDPKMDMPIAANLPQSPVCSATPLISDTAMFPER